MNWYCIHTKPLKEANAAAHLATTLNLETYFPRLKFQKTIRRVRRTVTRPLFPRYFFCRFDISTSFRAVRYAPEVIDVVVSGENPVVVADRIIDNLKCWAGEAVDVITIKPDVRAGDLVEITEGPMQGLQAIILHERSDRDRVAVLLSMLEYGAKLMISRSQFIKVS
jgi:transcriptional antiterminator RfaH